MRELPTRKHMLARRRFIIGKVGYTRYVRPGTRILTLDKILSIPPYGPNRNEVITIILLKPVFYCLAIRVEYRRNITKCGEV